MPANGVLSPFVTPSDSEAFKRRHMVLTNDLLRILRQERRLMHQNMQLVRLLSCFPKPVCLDLTVPHASAVYGGSGLYVTYNVQVRDRSQELAWQCFRRYSDCKELHQRFGGKFCNGSGGLTVGGSDARKECLSPAPAAFPTMGSALSVSFTPTEEVVIHSVVSDCRPPDDSSFAPGSVSHQIEQLLAVRRVETGAQHVSHLIGLSNQSSLPTAPSHALFQFEPVSVYSPDSLIEKCTELHREKEKLLSTVQQFVAQGGNASAPPSHKPSALASHASTAIDKKSKTHVAGLSRHRAPPTFGATSASFPPVLLFSKTNRSKAEIERRRAKLESYLQSVCNNLQTAYHEQLLHWGMRMLADYGGPNGEADVALGVILSDSTSLVAHTYSSSTAPVSTKSEGASGGLIAGIGKAGGGLMATSIGAATPAASAVASRAHNGGASMMSPPPPSIVRAAYMDVGTASDVHYVTSSNKRCTTRGSGGTVYPESNSTHSSVADPPATPTATTTFSSSNEVRTSGGTLLNAPTTPVTQPTPPCNTAYTLGDVQPPPHLTPPNLVYLTGLLRFLQYPFVEEWESCVVSALLPPELVSRASRRHQQQEANLYYQREQVENDEARDEDRYEVTSECSEQGPRARRSRKSVESVNSRDSSSSRRKKRRSPHQTDEVSAQDSTSNMGGGTTTAAERIRQKLDEKRWDRLTGGDSLGRMADAPAPVLSRTNSGRVSTPEPKSSLFRRFVSAIAKGDDHVDPKSGLNSSPPPSPGILPKLAPRVEDGGVAIRILQSQSVSSVSFSSSQRSFSFDSDLSSVDRCFADTNTDMDGSASAGSPGEEDSGAPPTTVGPSLITSRWRAPALLPSDTLGLIMPLVNIHKSIEGTWEVSMRQSDKETRKGRLRHSYDEASAVAAELACRDALMDANEMQSFVVAFRRKHPIQAYIRVEKALDQTLSQSHPASQRDRRGASPTAAPSTPTTKGQYQAALKGLADSAHGPTSPSDYRRHGDDGFTIVGSPLPHINHRVAGGNQTSLAPLHGLYEGEDAAQRRLLDAQRSKFSPPTQRFPAGFSPSRSHTLFHSSDAEYEACLLNPAQLIAAALGSEGANVSPHSTNVLNFMKEERADPLRFAHYLGVLRTACDQWRYLHRAVDASFLAGIGAHFSLREGYENVSLGLVKAAQEAQRQRFTKMSDPVVEPPLASRPLPSNPQRGSSMPIDMGADSMQASSRYFRPYAKKASSILAGSAAARVRRKSVFDMELDHNSPADDEDIDGALKPSHDYPSLDESQLEQVWSELADRVSTGGISIPQETDSLASEAKRGLIERLLVETSMRINVISNVPATSSDPLSPLPFAVAGRSNKLMVPTATALYIDQIRGAAVEDCRCTRDLLCANPGEPTTTAGDASAGDVFITPCGYCLIVCPPPFTPSNAPPLYSGL